MTSGMEKNCRECSGFMKSRSGIFVVIHSWETLAACPLNSALPVASQLRRTHASGNSAEVAASIAVARRRDQAEARRARGPPFTPARHAGKPSRQASQASSASGNATNIERVRISSPSQSPPQSASLIFLGSPLGAREHRSKNSRNSMSESGSVTAMFTCPNHMGVAATKAAASQPQRLPFRPPLRVPLRLMTRRSSSIETISNSRLR